MRRVREDLFVRELMDRVREDLFGRFRDRL